MQVKYYNSVNNQWEGVSPLPPEEIYIGSTPPAQGINAKLWLDTSVTGLLPASYTVADNCEQTVAGQAALDAHQGYLLQNQINNLSEDFIVEQGTNGIWTYRKWNSGIAECWGDRTITHAVTRAWGGWYLSASGTTVYEEYPANLFISTPNLIATLSSGGSAVLMNATISGESGATKDRTAYFILARGTSDTVTAIISFYAKGTWK